MQKSMVMKCDAEQMDFSGVQFQLSQIEDCRLEDASMSNIACAFAKFENNTENDDTDWTGTIKALARPADDQRNKAKGLET